MSQQHFSFNAIKKMIIFLFLLIFTSKSKKIFFFSPILGITTFLQCFPKQLLVLIYYIISHRQGRYPILCGIFDSDSCECKDSHDEPCAVFYSISNNE